MNASAPPAGSGQADVAAIVMRLRAAGCVFAEDETALLLDAADSADALERMVAQRVEGLPLEHILGWAEFAGLRIAVDPGVFVPRRRTELLVAEALTLLRPGAVVLDLCCGSGAVGAAIAAAAAAAETGAATTAPHPTADDAGASSTADARADQRAADPRVTVYAADIDPAAVRSARRNLPGPGRVFEGDLYDALPGELRGSIDLLVVNAPYVPSDAIATMPPEARLHEARIALDGGDDGLDVQRRVATDAPSWLSPTGHLLIETSERQAPTTAAIFAAAGLHPRIVHDDEFDATVVIGSRESSAAPPR
ncbi:HemK family protein methyltransferase [Herbiconiux sp. CPCC 205763]|uniref:HemK family protein methyltransferase n=1 Tax=Herbiconiux aconitum TaxID=2970913 RepID=A0ABT2GPA0_9MICO|nr:HemK family protein methyltransferase [Herbiconiux aconitum]MCS5717120.1 HemK family protein methyltransferase [Herbiconiux aconitum]